MSNLLKNRTTKSAKKRRSSAAVVYTLDGRVEKGKLSKGKKAGLITAGVFASLALLIYVPPVFYKEPSTNTTVPITPDVTAVKLSQSYLKDNPDADFDEDGLINSLEDEYGTNPWKADSDYDGVSDYAELFLTESTPTKVDTSLIKKVKDLDKENGDTIDTPYKVDDIILWPDDYSSKSYGGVVRTLSGYRFCFYTGWVKFPETVYAYGYHNGIHYELEHKENEDAWRIDSSDEVLLYSSQLKFVHVLKLPFCKEIYLGDSGFGKILTSILPDKGGFFTCYKAASIDTKEKEEETVTATLRSPLINKEDVSRFGSNMNSLMNLSWLRKQIENDECVAVSLYSSNAGEAIGIIYGYNEEGDLLIADENLNPVGELKITEYAEKCMDKDGNIAQVSWFEFEGLGFDSIAYGDRISFFSSTITSVDESSNNDNIYTEETESQTEQMTEKIETEPQTEMETEKNDSVITFGF